MVFLAELLLLLLLDEENDERCDPSKDEEDDERFGFGPPSSSSLVSSSFKSCRARLPGSLSTLPAASDFVVVLPSLRSPLFCSSSDDCERSICTLIDVDFCDASCAGLARGDSYGGVGVISVLAGMAGIYRGR